MPPKYPKHDAALAYARSQIGVYEVRSRENGFRSNRGPIQRTNPRGGVDFYQEHDFLAGVGYAWCNTLFLTAWEVGAKYPLPYKSAGSYDLYRWAQRAGWARLSANCIPGDGICFNIGTGHWATLESQTATTVTTIDGNVSNRVERVTRSKSEVRGGLHVPESMAQPTFVHEPFWVVTTSVNGKKRVVLTQFATQKAFMGPLAKLALKYGKNGITFKRSKTTRKRRVN